MTRDLCYAISRLESRYPDKAGEIRSVLGYWVHELRDRFRRERFSTTLASFELEAAAGWLPSTFLAYYDLYRFAEYGFNEKLCKRKWFDYECAEYEEAYKHWLGLIEQTSHSLALLGLAEPISLEQWLEKTKQPRPKPAKPQPIPQQRPRDIIEWLKAIAHA